MPLTVDAQTSRPSSTGVEILRSKLQSSDSVVVFDLGTNDDPAQPQALASDLASVRQIAGGRCIVVATLTLIAAALALQLPRLGALGVIVSASLAVSRSA